MKPLFKKSQTIRFNVAIFSLFFVLSNPIALAKSKMKTVLVVRSEEKEFTTMYESISKDLKKKYQIEEFIFNKETKYSDFAQKMKSENPNFLLLMDNKSVNFGMEWNKSVKNKTSGLAMMGLNLQSILKNNEYFSGIAFELPVFALVTQFKYIIDTPVKNMLVFYRKSLFQEIVDQANTHLRGENITLNAVDVEVNGKSKEKIIEFMKTKAESLLQEGKVDVIWCMLDSFLLSKNIFIEFWQPLAKKINIPIISGIEQLVDPKMNFATFSISPDKQDLVGQAVQVIERILEENESPKEIGVQQIHSVESILNQGKAQELKLKIRKDRLSEVTLLE